MTGRSRGEDCACTWTAIARSRRVHPADLGWAPAEDLVAAGAPAGSVNSVRAAAVSAGAVKASACAVPRGLIGNAVSANLAVRAAVTGPADPSAPKARTACVVRADRCRRMAPAARLGHGTATTRIVRKLRAETQPALMIAMGRATVRTPAVPGLVAPSVRPRAVLGPARTSEPEHARPHGMGRARDGEAHGGFSSSTHSPTLHLSHVPSRFASGVLTIL
ncbi:MAG: hypothetical protein AMXMBFR83_07680 [Phycisphaerae bacterium]